MLIEKTLKYITIAISTVRTLLVYPFVQKCFAKGVMVGAIKECDVLGLARSRSSHARLRRVRPMPEYALLSSGHPISASELSKYK